jgi:hypothetical protein
MDKKIAHLQAKIRFRTAWLLQTYEQGTGHCRILNIYVNAFSFITFIVNLAT